MRRTLGAFALVTTMLSSGVSAQQWGPFNAEFPAGGDGLSQPLTGADNAVGTASAWTLSGWIEPQAIGPGTVLVAGFGDQAGVRRFLALVDGRPAFIGQGVTLVARAPLPAKRWTHVAITCAGGVGRLYVDGRLTGERRLPQSAVGPTALLAPRGAGPAFAGRLAGFALQAGADGADAFRARAARSRPTPLTVYQTGSPSWPLQVRQMLGQTAPQDVWTRPVSRAAISAPAAAPLPTGQAMAADPAGGWQIGGWRLAAAPEVAADGDAVSRASFDARHWYAATVPGTVLTTLVDRGVYPDPTHGLNNTAIPESLAHQDYWYRTRFDLPTNAGRAHQEIVLDGANYAAEVWLNGARLGTMKGAFLRGRFDVTGKLLPQGNVLAVRVSPPPHPGIAHEESLTAGVGENGGTMMLDGPTFGASEGWDWIPSIRDRETGLWQGVRLVTAGEAIMGDPQVVTTLPHHDGSVADVQITVPVRNGSAQPLNVVVRAAFDDVAVARPVTLTPGESRDVVLDPRDFPALSVRHPRLWWPNGYGDPALHDLTLTAEVAGVASDTRRLRFGMREVTYDLSLMDARGQLERVTVDPSVARRLGQRVVDQRHEAIRKVDGGWAMSLAPGAERSPAVTPVAGEAGLAPYLVLRVNGVRIAARGGNIGMDDMLKRVDRTRLEPYFRLHRDAHLNIVRNWMGQNTEPTFYDLADEYGLMVLNDFWESTQDYNVEAQDPQLFLANAADVVRRYRNHPSIVLWFGRNEGVPQPIVNEGLANLIAAADGTRLYMGSSNRINLQNSGPYNWRPPVEYFTQHARGFSVESGTPSLPTLEAWERAIPAPDRWPISDVWAYHDWHQTGNGAVTTYMDALAARFGPGTSLPDFERKAQMMQYESYRAIFEGFNAGLWTVNSGRMLWMTQPAWPSSAWQIFSHDYDTQASFYGVKKAAEPVHVQMNLPDYKVVLVNNRQTDLTGVSVRAHVVGLDGATLLDRRATIGAAAGQVGDALTLDLAPILARGMALVRLDASAADGTSLSSNFYWQAASDAQYRALTALPVATLRTAASNRTDGAETVTAVTLANDGATPAIEAKLTMFDARGRQILPAYFSDNYVSLLPGERRTVEVRYSSALAPGAQVRLRGWNVAPAVIRP